MVRSFTFFLLCIGMSSTYADTIGRYMNIASNIPKMEMKADQESQTWAHSARNILNLTSESIAESLMLANTSATQQGTALFCLPANTVFGADDMNNLIQQTYRGISSPESEKDNMTVSQVALLGMTQKYPCTQHVAAVNQKYQ